MREITLTNIGKTTKVDDDMFEYLSQWNWWRSSDGYVVRWKKNGHKKGNKPTLIFMHREIINTPKDMITDHINRDKLDNRSDNLRVCNHKQNNSNTKLFSTNTSGYRGVSWNKETKTWRVYVSHNNKNYYLGSFKNKHIAAEAWNKEAKKLKGEFVKLNNIINKTREVHHA